MIAVRVYQCLEEETLKLLLLLMLSVSCATVYDSDGKIPRQYTGTKIFNVADKEVSDDLLEALTRSTPVESTVGYTYARMAATPLTNSYLQYLAHKLIRAGNGVPTEKNMKNKIKQLNREYQTSRLSCFDVKLMYSDVKRLSEKYVQLKNWKFYVVDSKKKKHVLKVHKFSLDKAENRGIMLAGSKNDVVACGKRINFAKPFAIKAIPNWKKITLTLKWN
jgi:hypothetical protein